MANIKRLYYDMFLNYLKSVVMQYFVVLQLDAFVV